MKNQESTPKSKREFEVPKRYRIWITVLASIFTMLIISIYSYLICVNPKYLDPEKYGLSTLLIFMISLLLLVNLPWKKLGLRPKGAYFEFIELDEKVQGQAKNVSKEIADLQTKIDEVEKRTGVSKATNDVELQQLLIRFLERYKIWAFSPLRIKNWGADQPGYDSFNKYDLDDIKSELRRLLSKNMVVTSISKKGNTLYRFKKNG
jgi:hypothetical protein